MEAFHCCQWHLYTHVKSQAGSRRDPTNPTWDPGWEWRDPAIPTRDKKLIPPGIPPKTRD